MNDRMERLEADASQLNVSRGPDRDRWWQIAGAVAMVAGVVLAFVAYYVSLNKSDPRDINSNIILSVSMLALAVVGAAVFLRYSFSRFLRFWLLRQLMEDHAHIDRLVASIDNGRVPQSQDHP